MGSSHSVSSSLVRRVWAAVTRDPHASIREIADEFGLASTSEVGEAITVLSEAGYIEREPKRSRARRVVVPFIEVEG